MPQYTFGIFTMQHPGFYFYGVIIEAAGPAAFEWKDLASEAGYSILWGGSPKSDAYGISIIEVKGKLQKLTIHAKDADKFKKFLKENNIAQKPAWHRNTELHGNAGLCAITAIKF